MKRSNTDALYASLFVMLLGACTTSPLLEKQSGESGIEAWQGCAKRISELKIEAPGYYGAAGRGALTALINECGYLPFVFVGRFGQLAAADCQEAYSSYQLCQGLRLSRDDDLSMALLPYNEELFDPRVYREDLYRDACRKFSNGEEGMEYREFAERICSSRAPLR
jgi:hypothetical protein